MISKFLVVLCCIAAAVRLPSGAAFPRESAAWVKKAPPPKPVLLFGRQDNIVPQVKPSSSQYCAEKLHVLQRKLAITATVLSLSRDASDELEDDNISGEEEEMNLDILEKRGKRGAAGRRYRSGGGRGFARRRGGANATTAVMDVPEGAASSYVTAATPSPPTEREIEMTKRLTQLEHLVAKQTVEIRRLKEECKKLTEVSQAFAQVVELLREAGLQTDDFNPKNSIIDDAESGSEAATASDQQQKFPGDSSDDQFDMGADVVEESDVIYEYFDDTEIFGEAPASVTDAADAAGAAILAGILGGKQRMLVDVRDSELSRDSETLVQFIELAILPVAAGLEGLKSNRNRVKIVFPTVSQLLEYRRTMALAAPEVVSLSTLGFDPVEERDNIVVIVAPPPNDEEGLQTMNELLNPSAWNRNPPISQPVVVFNHHMVPLSGPAADFDVMYHLRLLSVQYMAGEKADEIFQQFDTPDSDHDAADETSMEATNFTSSDRIDKPDEALLEAAMKHAHEEGVHHGMTRAMVIRSYPKPWHVFVDVSPDTDADFVVADTFTEEPTSDEVNNAIVECLEGSEREDELVAQQMQQALDMKNGNLDLRDKNGAKEGEGQEDDEEDDDDFDDWYGLWTEDSV